MSSWVYLSYSLSSETPSYGNRQTFASDGIKEIEKGDSCNTSFWSFPNHLGTHVDFPKHFDLNGKGLDFYEADFWIFKNVYLLDISESTALDIIDNSSIEFDRIPEKTELLIVKTGYGKIRRSESYWRKGPSFSPGLAQMLRSRCPELRAMGIDTISISSIKNRELGREAHKAFLCNIRPILLIEDMNLCEIDEETCLKTVIAAPLRVSNTDGSPCTILGEIN